METSLADLDKDRWTRAGELYNERYESQQRREDYQPKGGRDDVNESLRRDHQSLRAREALFEYPPFGDVIDRDPLKKAPVE